MPQCNWIVPKYKNASTGKYLKLTRTDGGLIDLEDKTGTLVQTLYNKCTQWTVSFRLYIEHGVKSSGTTIVANITF